MAAKHKVCLVTAGEERLPAGTAEAIRAFASTNDRRSSISFLAASRLSPSGDAMKTMPSSLMSILTPVLSMMPLMVSPPLPMMVLI